MQGSTIATSVTTLILGLALLFAPNREVQAYDRPDFEVAIFDRDGLSLSQEASDGIVENLVAIANNPDSDSDLREKAIGLALRIDPMHVAARKAHVSFSNGKLPSSGTLVDQFQFAENADNLWKAGLELIRKKPSPADAELAPFLMEIALTAHPRPDGEKVWRLAEIANYKPQRWERFTTLQPDKNPSNSKMAALFETAKREPLPKNEADPFMEGVATPQSVPDFPGMAEAPAAKIRVENGKIPILVSTRAGIIPAFLHLDIREPSEDEASLFSLFAASGERRDSFEMKVRTTISRIELEGIGEAEVLIREAYPRWPDRKIAEFSLKSIDGEPVELVEGERRTVDVGFHAGILFFQAFSGNVSRSDYIFVGNQLQQGRSSKKITNVKNALKDTGIQNVVVRASAYPSLLEEALVNIDLPALFYLQFIGVRNTPEAFQVILNKSELPVENAIEAFDELVKAKPAQLSAADYLQNPAVKARLATIADEFPFHYSAKILHEIGSKPLKSELLIKRFVTQIDDIMKPLAMLYDRRGSEAGIVSRDIEIQFDEATSLIRKLRNDGLPREVFTYQKLSEEALNALEKYLGLKNRDTKMGEQSHRELKEAMGRLSNEREKLGVRGLDFDR